MGRGDGLAETRTAPRAHTPVRLPLSSRARRASPPHPPPPPPRPPHPGQDGGPPPSPPAPAFRSPLVLERALFRPLVRERAVFRPTWRFATPRNLQCISVSRNARGRARKSGAFQGKGALAVQKNNHESLGRTRKGSGGRNRRTRWRWRGRCSS